MTLSVVPEGLAAASAAVEALTARAGSHTTHRPGTDHRQTRRQ
ncbi:hypothetical protein [Mycobacterium canetti]